MKFPIFESYVEHDTCCGRRVGVDGCPGTVHRYADEYVPRDHAERAATYAAWAGDSDAWPIPITYCGEPVQAVWR